MPKTERSSNSDGVVSSGRLRKDLAALCREISACRICLEQPLRSPLPHDPRPVLQVSHRARLLIAGQAPGKRVHESGRPFTDPSGARLRQWMGVSEEEFYDASRIAIAPMGFCFPGYDARKADLPPRPECSAAWRDRLMKAMPQIETILVIGGYARNYHLPADSKRPLADVIRESARPSHASPRMFALPHPSWRNTGWLKHNPWFEHEVLPALRVEVARLIGRAMQG